MPLSAIFTKPIDRPIEGVIKADDEAHLLQEVEEYVLTNEVARRLDELLGAYLDYQGANGVWISGFFGSGKSHLLKMLALLFEDRQIDGQRALDLFLPKLADNTFLRADLQRAVAIPSRSILFNIDQKADVISKTEIDAVLAVFAKVFDEMCGYYGKQGYIAQFERDLDSRGLYDTFKQAFAEVSGLDWEMGREQALLEGHNIDTAYTQATGVPADNARGILDKYRADYHLSIEDFAETVDAYIQRQGPDFRLILFVDEVGQYVADSTKLMTNLQTVAESLATVSKGRAWLMVTAQEDMHRVFGDAGTQQTDDFSKIQDRFKTRLKLTSADVEEVIRKRLLDKNARGRSQLSRVYEAEHNAFRTLFDFADGSQTYHTYRDEEHFIQGYPFVPYQFPLFQSAIQGLSMHNAFEGRHSSVGERSMLAVFQQVAIQIGDHQIGQLATFDLMFEGIRAALKTQIQKAVTTAEEHLDDAFAVRLLKALFLVKYVKEYRATARNLTVLMVDAFETDLSALRTRVEAALALLEQQTYIQRTGEEYEYLTDEEKDIEQEIKATEVEAAAVADELGKLIFDTVIRDRKIRHAENGQDYAFTRKLDDRVLGRQYELTIHVVSPFHSLAGQDEVLRAQSMGRSELLVILPLNDRLMRDLLLYKQTDKYVRLNITTVQQGSVRNILIDKQSQNGDRLKALRTLADELVGEAALVVDARDLEIGSSDPRTRITQGFHALLTRAYPNLRMLRGIDYAQQDVAKFLRPEATLFGDHEATFSEAEQEALAFVQGQNRQGLRTTMQGLLSKFDHSPYGWYLAAIQGTVAKLLGRGKLEANRDGVILEEGELERALLNTHGYANLILEPQITFTASQVRRLRDFHANFFDGPPAANEAKALAIETGNAFKGLHQELVTLQSQSASYPFLAALKEPITQIAALTGRRYTTYLTELHQHEDALLDLKEEVLDPVRRFMHGQQREIYDEARRLLQAEDANFDYLTRQDHVQLQAQLQDPQVYRGDHTREIRSLLDDLTSELKARVQAEREATLAAIDARCAKVEGTPEYARLAADQQADLRAPFEQLRRSVSRQTLIAVMRDSLRRFDETSYRSILRRMMQWAKPITYPKPLPAGTRVKADTNPPAPCNEPAEDYEFVSLSSISVPTGKFWLESDADVAAYVAALKEALLKAIRDGKRIQL